MALNPSNSRNVEQLAQNGLILNNKKSRELPANVHNIAITWRLVHIISCKTNIIIIIIISKWLLMAKLPIHKIQITSKSNITEMLSLMMTSY